MKGGGDRRTTIGNAPRLRMQVGICCPATGGWAMEENRRADAEANEALSLKEFCDMDQLYKLIDNWSRGSGMSAVIVDTQGRRMSESFGMTEFCAMVSGCAAGAACCAQIWREEREGVYVCPLGFCDFSVPIALPDGRVLGSVLAGQALLESQDVDAVAEKAVELGLDGAQVREVLTRTPRKKEGEMQGAYALLREMLNFFVEKNYSIWKTNDELRRVPARKDRVLSQITRLMYSYNLTVDLESQTYTLITGTGMERTVEEYKRHSRQSELNEFQMRIIHPAYASRFSALLDFDSARRDPSESGFRGTLEYPVLYPGDEEYEWHEINVFIDTQEDGRRIANILGRDITEAHNAQEKSEKELRAATAKDQLLSGITKLLYSYNLTVNLRTGRYTLITGTGLDGTVDRMKAMDRYEEIYRALLDAIEPDFLRRGMELLSLESYRGKMEKTGHLGTEELPMRFGEKLEWQEINVFAGYDENGEAIINILRRDVTEAHDKADTKAQLEIANASSAAESAFLFNMSHDIRTPMNAIIGFAELLEKHLDDEALARSYIRKIQTANGFLLSLINNVLEMARIESGKATLDESCWNAYQFNDSLYAMFDSQMKEKGVEFVRSARVEHAEVICDETKLREIFLNILSNALKYTPAGGRITMTLDELASDRPGYAVYRTVIEDTGIGMSEEFLPHLFEEFTRERSSTESRVNGTGLGMPIVKRLVDLMQGTIEVESRIGKGTRFTVTIPHRIAGRREDGPDEKKVADFNPERFRGRRILLAEDNELNAEIAITILEEAGFEVEHAEDGVICVDMMEKAEPGYYDLILMDIQMPNMDGYKATQTIRSFSDPRKAGITIIAMTANAFEEDKQNAYRAGMNLHIAKPIIVRELMAALGEILD